MAWLLVLLAAFGQAAGDTTWSAGSDGGLYEASLAPRDGRVRIGEIQDWVLTLRTAEDDTPLRDVRIGVGGGMPGHGHGLPTQPAATEYLGDGRHVIAGVKLSMPGEWVLAFGIETANSRDRVVFEMQVKPWQDDREQLLKSLLLDDSVLPPPSPSNRVADNPKAAELGERLFFDPRLSANGKLSCASCHQPERFFTDGLPRAQGMQETARNTPTVIGAGHLKWFYWDGRRDSLWSQALLPLEAADEMGSDRVSITRLVGKDRQLRAAYEAAFGPWPLDKAEQSLPDAAGPFGDSSFRAAWSALDRRSQQSVNRVFANLGKALAAWQRTLPNPVSRFDRYVAAELSPDESATEWLTADERAGLELFLDEERTHCLRCHNGRWMTNGDFHNIGTGTFSGDRLDFGRVFGIRALSMDEFSCLGPYSDARPESCKEMRFLNRGSHVPLEGAFKVPSLRNVKHSAPYMHDGRFKDLESVIAFYRNPPSGEAAHELFPLDIDDEEAAQLIAFLNSLTWED